MGALGALGALGIGSLTLAFPEHLKHLKHRGHFGHLEHFDRICHEIKELFCKGNVDDVEMSILIEQKANGKLAWENGCDIK